MAGGVDGAAACGSILVDVDGETYHNGLFARLSDP
jgi:hypothetical protein